MQKPKMIAKNGVAARQHLLHTFLIDYQSEQDDMEYTTKKMSISDMAALGVRKTELNGGYHHSPDQPGMGVPAETDDFNSMIAHLEIALQDFPVWWDLDAISDVELLGKVFQEVISHENSFLDRKRRAAALESSKSDGSGETDRQGSDNESGARGVAREMVDEKVQAALEP